MRRSRLLIQMTFFANSDDDKNQIAPDPGIGVGLILRLIRTMPHINPEPISVFFRLRFMLFNKYQARRRFECAGSWSDAAHEAADGKS
jgi:hypothetical protein